MLYTFILGRTFTISIAEILAVFKSLDLKFTKISASSEVLVVEFENEIEVDLLQKKLGGTIKIAEIAHIITREKKEPPLETTLSYLTTARLVKLLSAKSGKNEFGVSVYLIDESKITTEKLGQFSVKKLGVNLKKTLKNAEISSRVLLPENNSRDLSSATVLHNHLTEKGSEIVFIIGESNILIGKTKTVQDIQDYTRRDFHRPVKDMRRGQTPPKLAQAMINLSGLKAGEILFDPFCGLGTYLQEGLLMGLKVIGSDIDAKAIVGSKTNLEWLCSRYNLLKSNFTLFATPAESATTHIPPNSQVKAIVTEGTLGPPLSHFPTPETMKSTFAELKKIYEKCLEDWAKTFKTGFKIVICLPAYKRGEGEFALFPTLDFVESLGYSVVSPIPLNLASNWKILRITKRNTMIYDREDQIVAREIIILERK